MQGVRVMCVGAGSAFVPECVYVLDLQLQSIIYKVNIELVCFDVITVNVKDNTHYYYNVIKLFTRFCSVCYFCPIFSDIRHAVYTYLDVNSSTTKQNKINT